MFQENISDPSSRIWDCFTHEDGSDNLFLNVGNQPPTYTARCRTIQSSKDLVSDCVNSGETTLGHSRCVGEIWNGEEGSGSDDGHTGSFQFLSLMKQSPGFEIISKYSCSCKTDTASLSRPKDLERESCSSFITPYQQSRHHCSVLKSNIPGMYKCMELILYLLFTL